MFLSFKQKAEKMKNKKIKMEVKQFKKLCINNFKTNINRGITVTTVDFFPYITSEFEDEISEIVLAELKHDFKTIEFSFSYRHYQNSYKGIKMVAI